MDICRLKALCDSRDDGRKPEWSIAFVQDGDLIALNQPFR